MSSRYFEIVSDRPYESDPVCGEATRRSVYDGPFLETIRVNVRCACGLVDEFTIGVEGLMHYECECGRTEEIDCSKVSGSDLRGG